MQLGYWQAYHIIEVVASHHQRQGVLREFRYEWIDAGLLPLYIDLTCCEIRTGCRLSEVDIGESQAREHGDHQGHGASPCQARHERKAHQHAVGTMAISCPRRVVVFSRGIPVNESML